MAPAFGFSEQTVGPVEAPFFESETQELFVFVDLSQWLSSAQLFQPFEQISITDGLNDMLPGFLFSTSLIVTVGDQVVMQNWYTGSVVRVGIVDGETIPEPGTLALLEIGLADIGVARAREHLGFQRG